MTLAAALAIVFVARGRSLEEAIAEDEPWGTTTMRPRILTWLRAFTDFPASEDVAPRLHELASSFLNRLESRWPSALAPSYPALAMPGDALATIPDTWDET